MFFSKLVDVERLTQEIQQSNIITALDHISAAGTNCDIVFKSTLSSVDSAILSSIMDKHIPLPLPEVFTQNVNIVNNKKTLSGRQEVSIFEPEGSSATIASHDFCNKTTWWQTSLPVVKETLTASSTTVFSTSHTFIVDMTHGLCYDEDTITKADPTLIPSIYIDNFLLTTGYSIDYKLGRVTLTAPTLGVVTASYRYAVDSYFIIQPRPGQVLSINNAQCQFTSDIHITSPVVFEVWYNHPTYRWVPVPGTKITYKNEKDFVTACNGGQSTIQAWGNFQFQTIILVFDYARPKPLRSSSNIQIRIYLKTHTPLEGTFANATFYVTTEVETV